MLRIIKNIALAIVDFVVAYWKIVLPAVVVLVVVIFLFRVCGKSARLDEQSIQDGQNAMREKEYERAKEILANADVKEKVIAGEVANSAANTEAAKQEAKKKYANMNAAELQAEFNK